MEVNLISCIFVIFTRKRNGKNKSPKNHFSKYDVILPVVTKFEQQIEVPHSSLQQGLFTEGALK